MANEIKSLPKWLLASLAKHFQDNAAAVKLPMYMEGTGRKTNQSSDYFEFRVNGPFINQTLINEYKVWITINILLANIINEQDQYTLNINQGKILAAFVPAIPIYRYGIDIDDDKSFFDCVILDPDAGEKIKVINFGQLSANVRVMESTIEATYQMYYHPDPPY